LAKAVGDGGRVYAIEIQKDMAEKLKIEANKMGLQNIDIIWGDAEHEGGTRLRDDLLDGAVVANILFQIGDKAKFVGELKRILKVGAKVLVIDWLESYGGMGPHSDDVVTK
jgi:ubiquinone/menaquinone biosynthesis C-methylase UbiE